MTTQFISRFFGCFLTMILVSQTFAQKSYGKKLTTISLTKDVTATVENDNTGIESDVNTKVLGSFLKYFDQATKPAWSGVGKNFLARFTNHGKETRALFTKKGYLVYSIAYGTEYDLPAETRKLVKGAYVDYTIASATEVKEENRIIWVVMLKDASNLVFVRVEDGTMEETKYYQLFK